jgi:hypothetical protein
VIRSDAELLRTRLEPSRAWRPGLLRSLPWLALGLLTAAALRLLAPTLPPETPRADLLLLAASFAALWTALGWLACQGALRSTRWAVAWGICFWLPYANLVIASIYARRYWGDGARTPALLGIAAMVGQTVATLRMLGPALPTLV